MGYYIENREVPRYQPRRRRGNRKLSVWQLSTPAAMTKPASLQTVDLFARIVSRAVPIKNTVLTV